jgi:hypothetical protein
VRVAASFLAVAAVLAVAASGAASRTQVCAARSIGPGTLVRGNTTGADCMLRAYLHGCSSATYRLSIFGVDTVATVRFQLVRRSGSCAIDATRSFRVVPQEPHLTAVGRCMTLRRASTDVVATGCSGSGLSATMSLTR